MHSSEEDPNDKDNDGTSISAAGATDVSAGQSNLAVDSDISDIDTPASSSPKLVTVACEEETLEAAQSQQKGGVVMRGLRRSKKDTAPRHTATVVRPLPTKMGLRRGRHQQHSTTAGAASVGPISKVVGLSRGFNSEKFGSSQISSNREGRTSGPHANIPFDVETPRLQDDSNQEEEDRLENQEDNYHVHVEDASVSSVHPSSPPGSIITDAAEAAAISAPEPMLVTARLVEENEDEESATEPPHLIVEARETHWKDYLFNRYVMACAGTGLVVFVVVIVAVLAATASGGETDLAAEAPAGQPVAPMMLLSFAPSFYPSSAPSRAPLYTRLPAFTQTTLDLDRNKTGPQSMALEWLEDHPDFEGMDEPRMLQLFGLATFYFATQGEKWIGFPGGQSNWLDTDMPECAWGQSAPGETAECDSNGLYTKLQLDRANLQGRIPPEISLLSSLKFLELTRSNLQGSLPEEMFGLTQLTHLDLFANDLTGPIPASLPQYLADLSFLKLTDNDLTGTIHSSFGKMANLVHLTMTSNQLSGAIPSQLGLLTKLSILQLSTNQLSSTIPTTIGNLSLLRRFKAVENNLTGSLPKALGALTEMTSLSVSSNALLQGSLPSELGLLTELVILQLRNCNFSGAVPSEFASLTQLETLWLEGNALLSGSVPVGLCNNSWGTNSFNGLKADCGGGVACSCAACQCAGD